MLTPKTIAMNAANAPHWTLYRRTANRRNQPRTIPMRMRPTWLMSIAFPRRMGEIPRIPDKGVGAVLTRNNDATPGEPAARLNYLGARCPTGVALVRFDRVSRLRHRERCDEHLLRELRDPSWLGPRGGTRRARGRGFGGLPATSFPTVNFGLVLLYAIATFVVSAILTSIVTGAMTEYAVRRYRGEPMTVEQALRRGLARFPSILGANILLGLIL